MSLAKKALGSRPWKARHVVHFDPRIRNEMQNVHHVQDN
jgi:hypothetical protein